jgi:putative ABC transport system substrate-binding protein
MLGIRRRDIITLLGSAAAWPIAARAQQRQRTPRIGVLMNLAADDPSSLARVSALVLGLQALGWTVGRNVQIEYRWSAGDPDHVRQNAVDMVALAPDVIVASMLPMVQSRMAAQIYH